MEYSDGFGVHVWHGVRVPSWVIDSPDRITPENTLAEDNQEIRRIMLERYGWDRLIRDLGATEEHADRFGILLSTDKLSTYLEGEDELAKFVMVQDPSTDRRYALRVPPNTITAKQGVAWTFCQQEENYNPIQEA